MVRWSHGPMVPQSFPLLGLGKFGHIPIVGRHN
jgi:hypothetical protein